jgi:PTS system mannose-specific IIB component/fructoselysine and glucoselysine-specific PTS system IIB component
MSIVLYRVDERLIHGQVVVGWGSELRPNEIVVVDDDLATSPWEQELYAMGLPDELTTSFETVADARAHLEGWRQGKARVLLLTRDVATMRRLAQAGALRGEEVNIGGIHYAVGREPVLPYVYLSQAEMGELMALESEGVRLSARDLPDARRVELKEMLKGRMRA